MQTAPSCSMQWAFSPEAAPEVVNKMLTEPWLLHAMGVPTALTGWLIF